MTSAKDDEDFWYSSEKRSFCFENNEVEFTKLPLIVIFCHFNQQLMILNNRWINCLEYQRPIQINYGLVSPTHRLRTDL